MAINRCMTENLLLPLLSLVLFEGFLAGFESFAFCLEEFCLAFLIGDNTELDLLVCLRECEERWSGGLLCCLALLHADNL